MTEKNGGNKKQSLRKMTKCKLFIFQVSEILKNKYLRFCRSNIVKKIIKSIKKKKRNHMQKGKHSYKEEARGNQVRRSRG